MTSQLILHYANLTNQSLVLYAPARFELYSAENLGAYLNVKRISVNKPHGNEINIVASKSHLNKETKSFIELIKKI